MKKILLYLPIIMLTIWSCNQMDDVYKELDEKDVPYSEKIEYTFTDADYKLASKAALLVATNESDSSFASSIEKNKAFNELYAAADFVGPILAKNFPALNLNSVALVTYKVETGTPEEHMPYLEATRYSLDDADYISVGGIVATNGIFFPSVTPEAKMSTILTTNFASAEEGDAVLVQYKYSDTEPGEADPIEVNVFEENFNLYANYDTINEDGWMHFEEVGTRSWLARVYSGNGYAQFSSFGSAAVNVAWQITPEIDLSNTKIYDYEFTFDINVGYYTHEGLQIYISEDFDGSDVLGATWDDVTSNFTLPTGPTNTYGTFASAGILDLTPYAGSNIYIAFKYSGDAPSLETTTYQVDNVVVSGLTEPYKEYEMFYTLSGTTWSKSDVRVIQPFEYAPMGSPGNYNNFSSSYAPENYLPQFLAITYPYAQEGELITMAYNYYNGGTVIMLDNYIYESGSWSEISTIVDQTGQFIYSDAGWLFDPTVKFTMLSADYYLITDWVLTNLDPLYGYTDGSREFYYGSAGKYSNFDLRVSKRDYDDGTYSIHIPGFAEMTEKQAIDTIWSRLPDAINLLLTLKYPNAVTDVSGIDVHYFVTFYAYENDLSSNYYTIEFQCTKSGPNPEFTQNMDYANEEATEEKIYPKYGLRKVE